jgi:hypothetical protein
MTTEIETILTPTTILTEEQLLLKKIEKKKRQKEARKNRKKLVISFSTHKTNVHYSKFTTKELVAAKSLLELIIEHRTKGLSDEPQSPRKTKVQICSEELIKRVKEVNKQMKETKTKTPKD